MYMCCICMYLVAIQIFFFNVSYRERWLLATGLENFRMLCQTIKDLSRPCRLGALPNTFSITLLQHYYTASMPKSVLY